MIVVVSGIVLDIDEEKQLEETLRTREGHLQSILETIPDAMGRTRLDRRTLPHLRRTRHRREPPTVSTPSTP